VVCSAKSQYVTSAASGSHLQEQFRSRDLDKYSEFTISSMSSGSPNWVHILEIC